MKTITRERQVERAKEHACPTRRYSCDRCEATHGVTIQFTTTNADPHCMVFRCPAHQVPPEKRVCHGYWCEHPGTMEAHGVVWCAEHYEEVKDLA